MSYFVKYNDTIPTAIGKLFDTKQKAIVTALKTLSNFRKNQENRTAEIFGMDFQTAKEKNMLKDGTIFFVYELSDGKSTASSQSVKSWQLQRLVTEFTYRELILLNVNKYIMNDLNNREIEEYFYQVVYGFQVFRETKEKVFAEEFIVKTYVALIQIANHFGVYELVLGNEYVEDIDYIKEISHLAMVLDGITEIENITKQLILCLWEIAESKYQLDFVECIYDGIFLGSPIESTQR